MYQIRPGIWHLKELKEQFVLYSKGNALISSVFFSKCVGLQFCFSEMLSPI